MQRSKEKQAGRDETFFEKNQDGVKQ